MTEEAKYLLLKRGLYWRFNSMGYTGLKSEAQTYSDAESAARCNDGVTRILEDEASIYSPSCPMETKLQYCEKLLHTIAALDPAPEPIDDEYGFDSCHVEGYNCGLEICQKIARRIGGPIS